MKNVLIGGGIILVIIVIWNLSQRDGTSDISNQDTVGNQPTLTTETELTLSETDLKEEGNGNVEENTRNVAGSYQPYSAEALAASTATHNILIFSATWCPSCRALDKDINENISDLPGDVALFTIDYDTNVALRQQYGVTSQHTLVLVETDGTEIKEWTGGNTLTSLLSNI